MLLVSHSHVPWSGFRTKPGWQPLTASSRVLIEPWGGGGEGRGGEGRGGEKCVSNYRFF